MANNGKSEKGIFGDLTHYDGNGNKIGRSEKCVFGGYTNYDAKGNKIGHSEPGIFGGYTHYDNKGHKIGSSDATPSGSYIHRDANGHRTGASSKTPMGDYKNTSGDACYVATCVYGSYDCPEVWTLRRFRDDVLRQSVYGKAFVKFYYTVSPATVKWFGKIKWIKKTWKAMLDRLVTRLNQKGIEDTPYKDK